MGESKSLCHENHYRSHTSMELGRENAIKILGAEIVETAEKELKDIIASRIEEDGDAEKRGFKEKWLVSLYTTNFVVKEKAEKKKVPKKVEKKELPKSLEIKKDRVTSQNLTMD